MRQISQRSTPPDTDPAYPATAQDPPPRSCPPAPQHEPSHARLRPAETAGHAPVPQAEHVLRPSALALASMPSPGPVSRPPAIATAVARRDDETDRRQL